MISTAPSDTIKSATSENKEASDGLKSKGDGNADLNLTEKTESTDVKKEGTEKKGMILHLCKETFVLNMQSNIQALLLFIFCVFHAVFSRPFQRASR